MTYTKGKLMSKRRTKQVEGHIGRERVALDELVERGQAAGALELVDAYVFVREAHALEQRVVALVVETANQFQVQQLRGAGNAHALAEEHKVSLLCEQNDERHEHLAVE